MGTDISTRQQEILDYIRDTVADRGYPPSVREIGEAVGLSSPSTVHSHLSTLEATGHLRRDPTKPRAIEILDEEPSNVRNVPLVGRIAAGSPILAEEDIEDVIPLPVDLVGDGPIFMLRVKGESMIDAGILDGDYVVIHRQPDALDGEIVAALIDGEEATVKR
ncbi:MAG: transcriptional repressor LexA, partial [Acidimicrobiia bacterium]|nr:transcriptional repressor LexA [Acidimicrobiia bacterium]